MKRIIDGKRYNTETATEICDVSAPGFYRGDFRYEDTQLYCTPRGGWFLAGEGGPMSRWARSVGLTGSGSLWRDGRFRAIASFLWSNSTVRGFNLSNPLKISSFPTASCSEADLLGSLRERSAETLRVVYFYSIA